MNDINIWQEIADTMRGLFGGLLNFSEQAVTQGLPRLILAGVTLIVGWLVAVFVRKLTAKGLRGFGFDVVTDRVGLNAYLDQRGVHAAPSAIVAWALYAWILYSALLLAFERIAFETGIALLAAIAIWLPRILVALILLAIGQWIGRWLGSIVTRAAHVAMIPFAPIFGGLVQLGILIFALMLSVRYLGLASDTLLLTGLALVLGAALLSLFLVALCARDVLLSFLAVRLFRAQYPAGDRIRIDQWEGEIVGFKQHALQLRTADGVVSVPAVLLMREPVIRLS